MLPTEKARIIEFLARLTTGLASAVGDHCEIVLHDFSDPGHSIVAIANGHITGRSVGDTLDVLGLQLLKKPPDGDLLNYRTISKDGKTLRSSSIFLRDEQGEIFGSLCINFDISAAMAGQDFLRSVIKFEATEVEERFEHSVDEVLDRLMHTAIASTGKTAAELNREEKIAVVEQLESKGAFLIRYSVNRVAEMLGMSKYTIYNYLDKIKERNAISLATTATSRSDEEHQKAQGHEHQSS
jgi:predicted transcriptional regulator YheO